MFSDVLVTGITFLSIDIIYLKLISNYFNSQIKSIQGSPLEMDIFGAILSYIFLILGLYYFIIRENKSVFDAFLYGLVIYMVYEGTNKAIIKNWSWKTVAIDGIWGGIVSALTTYIAYNIKG